MSIYTRTGDKGQTSLATGERVAKTDPRLEAYGTADELNSWIGLLRAAVDDDWADANLEWIQQRLFNIGAALSGAPGEWISEDDIRTLEQGIDQMLEEAPLVRAFVLPAGSEMVARSHVCRTVTRRLERLVLHLDQYDDRVLRFINRLSDYMFAFARFLEHKNGENPQKWDKNAQNVKKIQNKFA